MKKYVIVAAAAIALSACCPAYAADPVKCENKEMLIGYNKDGKLCWSGAYDDVGKKLLQSYIDLQKQYAELLKKAQQLQLQLDVVTDKLSAAPH